MQAISSIATSCRHRCPRLPGRFIMSRHVFPEPVRPAILVGCMMTSPEPGCNAACNFPRETSRSYAIRFGRLIADIMAFAALHLHACRRWMCRRQASEMRLHCGARLPVCDSRLNDGTAAASGEGSVFRRNPAHAAPCAVTDRRSPGPSNSGRLTAAASTSGMPHRPEPTRRLHPGRRHSGLRRPSGRVSRHGSASSPAVDPKTLQSRHFPHFDEVIAMERLRRPVRIQLADGRSARVAARLAHLRTPHETRVENEPGPPPVPVHRLLRPAGDRTGKRIAPFRVKKDPCGLTVR